MLPRMRNLFLKRRTEIEQAETWNVGQPFSTEKDKKEQNIENDFVAHH